MAEMSSCMKLIARMSEADQADLLERVDSYIASGIAPKDAQTMAANDMLADIRSERADVIKLVEEQHPQAKESPVVTWAKEQFGDRTAANGKPMWQNFVEWFGDSKVVDENGKPLVVYHGTMHDIRDGVFKDSTYGPVSLSFFTDDTKTAGVYARGFGRSYRDGSNVVPVYLSLKNPKILDFSDREDDRDVRAEAYLADEEGYDGLIVYNAFDGRQSKATQYVAFRPNQIKSAIGNNGDFSESDNISRSTQGDKQDIPWPSIRTALEQSKTNAGTSDYWLARLKDIAPEDLQASGFAAWLGTRPGKVSKVDVLAWVGEQAGEAQPARATQGDRNLSPLGLYSALEEGVSNLTTKAAPAAAWKDAIKGLVNKGAVKADEVEWSGVNEWLDTQQGKVTREALAQYLSDGGVRVEEVVRGDHGPAYKMENQLYRMAEERDAAGESSPFIDALLSGESADGVMRAADRSDSVPPDMMALAKRWHETLLGDVKPKYSQYQLPGGTNYREVLLKLPPAGEKYFQFVVREGGGRAFRFNGVDYATETEARSAEEAARASEYRSSHWPGHPNVLAHIRLNDRVDADGKRVLFVEEIQSDAAQEKRKGKTDWSAPYIDSTDKWLNLALKRIITMAVQEGYDKVAFVNGEQSAERYDLSKQVDKISIGKAPPEYGKWQVVARKDGEVAIDRVVSDDAELASLIGKELAEKAIAKNGGSFSGLDLKVGGTGMIAFYDQIVPNAVKALAKKLGGEVGPVHLGGSGYGLTRVIGKGWQVVDARNLPVNDRTFKNQQDAARWIVENDPTRKQPGVTITPAMREKVGQGLPAFSTQGDRDTPTWEAPQPSKMDDVIHALQDKYVDLKRVTQAIQATGKALSDRGNAYLREELYHSRVSSRVEGFVNGEVKPLIMAMRAAGVDLATLEEYLHARHARERNAVMRDRNPDRVDNEALSGMTNERADEILQAAPPHVVRLAERVDEMLRGTRQLMVAAGLETQETIDDLEASYQFYVPLHRDEAHPDGRMTQGMGFSIKGSGIRTATGSTEKVTNILAHIIEARENTIVRAEKNLVAMALYHMVITNPNPEFWAADDPPTKQIVDERKNIFNPGTGQMMANPRYGTVRTITDPNYKSSKNVIVLKVNGEDRSITFNESNPSALRLARSLKNLDADQLNAGLRVVAKGTRFLAAVNTQYNPVFAVVNGVRDLGGMAINLSSTPLNGKQAQIAYDAYRHVFPAVWQAERDTNASGQWVDLYRELGMRGGITGFRDQFNNIEERSANLDKLMNEGLEIAPVKAAKYVGGLVSDLNTAVENSVRVAAYKAALDKGMSKDQAASLAKNLTVNFNRKGASTSTIGALYAFFNASVQGNARLLETLTHSKGTAAAIVGGGIMLGVLQAMLTAGMDDDDEEAVSKFDREKNFIIPLGDGKFAKIPYPLGFHVIPNIGRHLTEMVLAKQAGDDTKAVDRLADFAGTLFDAANPLGSGSLLQVLMPTVADPIVQLAENKDFAGRPIYRERSEWDPAKAGSALGRDSTSPAYKEAAKLINRASGGSEKVRNTGVHQAFSPQPEALRHIVETIGGGVWRESERLLEATLAAGREDSDLETHRLPLVGRFYGDTRTPESQMGKFYENLSDLKVLADKIKEAEDAADGPRIEKLWRENPEAWISEPARKGKPSEVSAVRKEIELLRERRREMDDQDASPRELRAVDAEIGKTMLEFNRLVREERRRSP